MSEIRLFSIPNIATLSNLICGIAGIQFCFKGNMTYACYCIFLATIFDFLDGLLARLFKSSSELGKELDSLCDVVSFGVLPGFIVYSLLVEYKEVSFLIPVFSALRLAKFNIDQRQSDEFIGVPTPMNAFFVAGLFFVFQEGVWNKESNYILLFLTVLSSVMLIAEIPLLSLKFKNFTIAENIFRFVLIVLSVVLLLLLHFQSLVVIYFVYILLSLLKNFIERRNVIRS